MSRRFQIAQPIGAPAAARPSPPAWLALGFRPLFLVAAAFACVAMGMWLHALTTGADPSGGYLPPTWWHAHEMIFGFTLAVVAGFLLTASRNWTGRETLRGAPLLGLVALWIAGRVLMAGLFDAPGWLVALPSVAFPALLALAVGRVIVAGRSRRNYGIVAVLGLLTAAAALVHLDANGVLEGVALPALYGALHLIILLVVVIGGRIVPMFTRNRTGADARRVPAVDKAAIALAAAVGVLAAVIFLAPSEGVRVALAITAGASGLVQLFRMRTWGVAAGLRVPMLAILHSGCVWLGIGHLLLGLSLFVPALTTTVALHALTVGAIGAMTVGMMARVSMGHTGREIRASWPLTAAFVAMNAAVIVRLAAVVVPGSGIVATWILSGSLFAAAYLAYVVVAARWLVTPRPDGRPG